MRSHESRRSWTDARVTGGPIPFPCRQGSQAHAPLLCVRSRLLPRAGGGAGFSPVPFRFDKSSSWSHGSQTQKRIATTTLLGVGCRRSCAHPLPFKTNGKTPGNAPTTEGYHLVPGNPPALCCKPPFVVKFTVLGKSLCEASPAPAWEGRRGAEAAAGRSLRDQIFFFLLRTTSKDRPKGPPTANSHQPPTATNHQPPTATNRQPPTASHQPPTANHCQPPPTATNRQLPTANRQPPPTMVEHMECPRAFLGKLVPEHFFFSFFR